MRAYTLAALCLLAAASLAGHARAQGAVQLKPTSGHPNLPVTVTGTGFGDGEAIDVYVDTVDTALLVSSSTGTFSGSVTIPAAAQPGQHFVTAIGRHSGNAGQGPFTVTTPWTEQGFGAAHLGFNPYENTLNTGNVGSLGTLWQISPNGAGGAATVTGNRVFLGTLGGVVAVSATTGAQLWKSLTSGIFYASPAVVGNSVYIGDSASSMMYALNATTGAILWSQATGGGFYSSAVVVGGTVYVGCLDEKVYAFSAATGKILWTYTTGQKIFSSPAVVNGVVYIGSDDHSLYALNAATGALIWSYQTSNAVESSPAVKNGVVYIGSNDYKLYAINATGPNTGAVLWSYTTKSYVFNAPAVAYGYVYFGSEDGNSYAVDANSGALQWSVATGTTGYTLGLAVANGVAYLSSGTGTLFAVDALSGETLTTAVAGYTAYGNPTISDGVLYLNTYGYNTFAFALGAGNDAIRPHAHPPAPASLHPDMSLAVSH
jgi:outer membrane protein assembly factor BamB